MKRTLLFLGSLILGAATVHAQDKPARPLYISLQGGALVSVNENAFSYRDNNKTLDLITPLGGIAIGYDFSKRFGVRLSRSFGKNVSACNTRQTEGDGFYPYNFKSVNIFADAILNLKSSGMFSPKLYAGIGGAYTFNFSDPGHPWQRVKDGNTVFGFRVGLIAQWDLSEHFGLFADLCGEAYTDRYNGLRPSSDDHDLKDGYAGFPIDIRGIASLGVIFRL